MVQNPSFHYVVQLDIEEQKINIFWPDVKMIIDYAHFGDVFSFDTTFGTNKEFRPLAMLIGFNHHKEMVIKGLHFYTMRQLNHSNANVTFFFC